MNFVLCGSQRRDEFSPSACCNKLGRPSPTLHAESAQRSTMANFAVDVQYQHHKGWLTEEWLRFTQSQNSSWLCLHIPSKLRRKRVQQKQNFDPTKFPVEVKVKRKLHPLTKYVFRKAIVSSKDSTFCWSPFLVFAKIRWHSFYSSAATCLIFPWVWVKTH